MIKGIFFDVDGTLLDHSPQGGGRMPPSALEALRAARAGGVRLFVASGRIPSWVDFLGELFPFDGYVTVNGQLAVDRTGQVLHRQGHCPEDIRRLVALAGRDPFPCLIIEEKESFCIADFPVIRRHFAWAGLAAPPVYDPARLRDHPVLQFCLYIPREEAARRLASLEHIEITSAGGDILDVIPAGGGKEVGIAAVAEHYGWRREEIAVFGDGDNDLRMLRWAGVGVAMGNGTPAAKAAADFVTTPVGEDGIRNGLARLGVLPEEGQ